TVSRKMVFTADDCCVFRGCYLDRWHRTTAKGIRRLVAARPECAPQPPLRFRRRLVCPPEVVPAPRDERRPSRILPGLRSWLLLGGLSADSTLPVLYHSVRRTNPSRPAQQRQHSHAHGQAIGDLLQDGGLRAVGHIRCDLDAAIDGSGGQEQQ